MQFLAVDIGTGTQDIFLFDTRLDIENGFKLILPSPTMIVYRKVRSATHAGEPVLLTGLTMGGGPSHWAVEDHLEAGYSVYATSEAARSFNDDLEEIRAMGVTVVSADEATQLKEQTVHLELKDFDFELLSETFRLYGVDITQIGGAALAVFDHGAAPPQYSDRKFRFEYLDRQVRDTGKLSGFAYPIDAIPPFLTRMGAVAKSAAKIDAPVVIMDTAPAAVLGATLDPVVGNQESKLIANIGNFHTLAFRLSPDRIDGVFEHHTGFMNREKLEALFGSLADGSLTNEYVFSDKGHGALVYASDPYDFTVDPFGVMVVGPRRGLMRKSHLNPYFAAPFGDMMLVGCFGMVRATADLLPNFQEELLASLGSTSGRGLPPWEIGP